MPVVPLTMQFVATYTGPGGATAANVMHLLTLGGEFDQDAVDVINIAWGAFYDTVGHEDWTADGVCLFKDLSTDPADEIYSNTTPDDGDATGGVLPAQCAAVLSLSAGGGRRRKGRIYIPGIAESYVDDNSLLVSTFPTAALGAFEAYALEVATDAGWVPAVYSRTDGVARAVQTIGMDNVIDTQRRRVNRLA